MEEKGVIKPNVEHFQQRMSRVSNNVKMLQYKMSGYEFNLEKLERGQYDQLFFYVQNQEEALGLLSEIGLMFPPDTQLSRRKYFELYQNKKLSQVPEGYRMAIYFLVDNQMAEVVL